MNLPLAAPARRARIPVPHADPIAKVELGQQVVAIRLCALANTAAFFALPLAAAGRVNEADAVKLYGHVDEQLQASEHAYREHVRQAPPPATPTEALNIDTAAFSADQVANIHYRLTTAAASHGKASALRHWHADLVRCVERLLQPLPSKHPLRAIVWIPSVNRLAALPSAPLIHYLTVGDTHLEVRQRVHVLS